jgi:2-iminobutanoate/2-iminopropanoate deaminase
MGKMEVQHPDKLANTGSYSAGVICDGWLYVSGHASLNLRTGEVICGTVQEETNHTLTSIGKVLKEAGCSFDDVVKCTCYLARIEDFDEFDREYRKFFSGVLPARSTVQAGLGDGIKVEIDATARISPQKMRV